MLLRLAVGLIVPIAGPEDVPMLVLLRLEVGLILAEARLLVAETKPDVVPVPEKPLLVEPEGKVDAALGVVVEGAGKVLEILSFQ